MYKLSGLTSSMHIWWIFFFLKDSRRDVNNSIINKKYFVELQSTFIYLFLLNFCEKIINDSYYMNEGVTNK